MCGTSKNKYQKEKERKKSELHDYILEPFLEHKFEPLGWNDVLATVTICVNDVTPTLFCDKDGFDIILIQMVNVINIQEENNSIHELIDEKTIEIELNHVKLDNEVSTFDLSSKHKTQGENYYDVSDELEDLDL